MKDLSKVYDPNKVEGKWYAEWLRKGYFHAEPNARKKPYTIVIPPPNVTDRLHIGHAYNNTLQDIFIRFRRMQGYEALWMPGTDHAGIATQNVVERSLADEGLSRYDLGRKKFVESVWNWKKEKGGIIIQQLKKLGCSCDWERERFTMDEGLSAAVQEVFIHLHKKGLIYRGEYIVNWCPRCTTALSDEEAPHKEVNGNLWYIRYPIEGGDGSVTVATTRPETMLGDTAIAVNPRDERYSDLMGKTVILPLLNRKLAVIQDNFVEAEIGTGAVKVTPAHDPNDFQMGERHDLERINILNEDGTLNDNAGPYSGMERFEARKAVLRDLESEGLLEKVEEHTHGVGHCYRCGTMIEPYLSKQWFVKIKPLADKALEAVESGSISLHPGRWVKVYRHWMENIRDWCISRQLWWGHRIPAYHCADNGHITVAGEPPGACPECGGKVTQDPDVLDTWFSSWLWPFSTMGWPEKTPELEYFYPTSTLVTGHDILFFWVARMIMSGVEFMGDVPFTDVYLNGIVRDTEGVKMSKSHGNGIDPLEMIDRYSADAVRFSLLALAPEGQDIRIGEKDFELGRNFSNKVWNAFRLIASHLDDEKLSKPDHGSLELADLWIISRYNDAVKKVTENLDNFKVHMALDVLYKFFWGEFCDWYLELIKGRLYSDDPTVKEVPLSVSVRLLKGTMQLLHPFMPFISEEVYSELTGGESVVISEWPIHLDEEQDEKIESEMSLIMDVVTSVRTIRSQMHIPPAIKASLIVRGGDEGATEVLKKQSSYIVNLCRLDRIDIDTGVERPELSATDVVRGFEIFVPLKDLIDVGAERVKVKKDLLKNKELLRSIKNKLSNESFVNKAPVEVVEKEKQKQIDFSIAVEKLQANLEWLENAG